MRQRWADASKGLAIGLIVYGHVFVSIWDAGLAGGRKEYMDMIILMRTLVLPVFFLISGVFAAVRLNSSNSLFYRKWFSSIVWPYLLWGAVVVVMEQLLHGVRNAVNTSPTDLSLFWTPIAWLWFLYVLAIFQLLARALRQLPLALVALGVMGVIVDALWSLPVLLHLCSYHLIFYAVGLAFGPKMLMWRMPIAVGLGALVVSVPLALLTVPDLSQVATWPGIPATFAGMIGLCWLGQRFEGNPLLVYLGRRSMAIYVVHFFFISATRVVLAKGLGITSIAILIPASFIAGFFGALATYEIAARLGITLIVGLGFPAYGRSHNTAALTHELI